MPVVHSVISLFNLMCIIFLEWVTFSEFIQKAVFDLQLFQQKFHLINPFTKATKKMDKQNFSWNFVCFKGYEK